jgi:hypothetical protein
LQIPGESPTLKTPIFLELTDEIPPIIAYPLEEGLRGIPGVEQDKLGLTAETIPGITQQLQGESELGGSAFVPATKGQRNADLPIGPYQEDD